MSFIKHIDKWDRVIVYGIGKVKTEKNDLIWTISEPNKFTQERKIKFKACGGYKASDKPKENGEIRWLKQNLDFYVTDNHYYADLIKKLILNDVVEVFGVLYKNKYISSKTGREKNYYEVKLEKLALLYHADESCNINTDIEDIDNDFEDEYFD